jgi:hypothetical protein
MIKSADCNSKIIKERRLCRFLQRYPYKINDEELTKRPLIYPSHDRTCGVGNGAADHGRSDWMGHWWG